MILKILIRHRALAWALPLLPLLLAVPAHAQNEQSIVVLVNDQPISAYDVTQRLRFISASSRKKVTPQLRKQVIERLIQERIQLQEAKKMGINVRPDQINRVLDDMAKRNKMTTDQLISALRQLGVHPKTLKDRISANIAWLGVVRRKFGRQINVGQMQVDKALSTVPADAKTKGEKKTEYQLQRVRLPVSDNSDQRQLAQRLVEAEQLRGRFKSCESMENVIKGFRRATVKDIGRKTSDVLPQPTRAILANAKAGQMTPPTITASGIELYAVCGRKSVVSDRKQRQVVRNKLREQEYKILAQRHLRDLRQDAYIEYR